MRKARVYEALANLLVAIKNCEKSGNDEWLVRHRENLDKIVKNYLPSGGGFDAGVTLDDESNENRLVLNANFHHMNDAGYYDGWTDHKVIVTPNLASRFDLRVTGRNRNDIKDYISETFSFWLDKEVEY